MDEQEFYQHLSEKLKSIRKLKNLNQEEFANMLNLSFYHYQRIEAKGTKQTISISLLFQICNKLELDLKELF
jgi:transcriptional regulator with XRE-family HTH domain